MSVLDVTQLGANVIEFKPRTPSYSEVLDGLIIKCFEDTKAAIQTLLFLSKDEEEKLKWLRRRFWSIDLSKVFLKNIQAVKMQMLANFQQAFGDICYSLEELAYLYGENKNDIDKLTENNNQRKAELAQLIWVVKIAIEHLWTLETEH